MDNLQVWKDIVVSIVRKLLAGIGSVLIAKGYITSDQATFIGMEIAGGVFWLVTLVWTYLDKVFQAKLVNTALKADGSSTTLAEVREIAKDKSGFGGGK